MGTQQPAQVGQMHTGDRKHVEGQLSEKCSKSYKKLGVWISGLHEDATVGKIQVALKQPGDLASGS